MKIACINIVPWRTHFAQLKFMASVLEKMGHKTTLISCPGGRNFCYQHLYNDRIFDCAYCKGTALANKRAFDAGKKLSIMNLPKDIEVSSISKIRSDFEPSVLSSAASIDREEDDYWYKFKEAPQHRLHSMAGDYRQLVKAFEEKFRSEDFDMALIFNGRFHDVGAAIEAARNCNLPFMCHERSWFGKGIQLTANTDCLSLKSHRFTDDKELEKIEVETAYKLIFDRIRGAGIGEWKTYGQAISSKTVEKEIESVRSGYLVVPSSRSEFIGHDDYIIESNIDSIKQLDRFIFHYSLRASDFVVRCHPAWVVKMGKNKVSKSLEIYREWAKRVGAKLIEPDDFSVSTYSLMKSSKLAIFNGGSAAMEATILGVPSVLLSPCSYMHAGFVKNLTGAEVEWPDRLPESVTEDDKIRMLRYVWFRYYRQVSFFETVSAKSSQNYSFSDNFEYNKAEFERIISLTLRNELFGIGFFPGESPSEQEKISLRNLLQMDGGSA